MKVITEDNIQEYIIDRIERVYIGFDDNVEVVLNQVAEYDLDLDNMECSIVSFTNVLSNIEIENRFKGRKSNHIIYLHIEVIGYRIDKHESINVYYDIPCDMHIRRLRIHNAVGSTISEGMFIELEGVIK